MAPFAPATDSVPSPARTVPPPTDRAEMSAKRVLNRPWGDVDRRRNIAQSDVVLGIFVNKRNCQTQRQGLHRMSFRVSPHWLVRIPDHRDVETIPAVVGHPDRIRL